MKKLITIFCIGAIASACDNDKFPVDVPVKEKVSFKLDVQPILNQECVSCHSPSAANAVDPDLRTGFAYESLMALPMGSIVKGDAEASELVAMLNGGGDNPMPPGATISAIKIALIKKWIDDGALNN